MTGDTSLGAIVMLVMWALVGGVLQIVLWKTHDNTYGDALLRHGYLWFFYYLPAAMLGERLLRWLTRGGRPPLSATDKAESKEHAPQGVTSQNKERKKLDT